MQTKGSIKSMMSHENFGWYKTKMKIFLTVIGLKGRPLWSKVSFQYYIYWKNPRYVPCVQNYELKLMKNYSKFHQNEFYNCSSARKKNLEVILFVLECIKKALSKTFGKIIATSENRSIVDHVPVLSNALQTSLRVGIAWLP